MRGESALHSFGVFGKQGHIIQFRSVGIKITHDGWLFGHEDGVER